jgi:hypothetical protein
MPCRLQLTLLLGREQRELLFATSDDICCSSLLEVV